MKPVDVDTYIATNRLRTSRERSSPKRWPALDTTVCPPDSEPLIGIKRLAAAVAAAGVKAGDLENAEPWFKLSLEK